MRPLWVVVGAVGLALAACGGGADDRAGAPTAARVTSSTTSVPSTTTAAPTDTAQLGAAPTDSSGAASRATTASTTRRNANAAASGAPSSPAPDLFTPPAGTYTYRAQGTSTSQTGPTSDTHTIDATEIDTVTVAGGEGAQDVTVATAADGDTRSIRYRTSPTSVSVVELTFSSAGDSFVLSVVPDPPLAVARLPYRDGDHWQFAWQDAQAGLRAVGTGAVVGRESIGSTSCWVLELKQKLSGSMTGTFDTTLWVDPASGRHLREHLVTRFQNASGRDTTDVVRTLT